MSSHLVVAEHFKVSSRQHPGFGTDHVDILPVDRIDCRIINGATVTSPVGF